MEILTKFNLVFYGVQQLSKKYLELFLNIFICRDTQFVSGGIPGSGNYNPHDSLTKIRKNKTTYKDWLKKHGTQREKSDKKCRALPDPGTYKPLNSTFTTFDIIEKESKNSQLWDLSVPSTFHLLFDKYSAQGIDENKRDLAELIDEIIWQDSHCLVNYFFL